MDSLQVSITFDPFMYLTLPLPINKTWTHDVMYVPWDPSVPHVKVRGLLWRIPKPHSDSISTDINRATTEFLFQRP